MSKERNEARAGHSSRRASRKSRALRTTTTTARRRGKALPSFCKSFSLSGAHVFSLIFLISAQGRKYPAKRGSPRDGVQQENNNKKRDGVFQKRSNKNEQVTSLPFHCQDNFSWKTVNKPPVPPLIAGATPPVIIIFFFSFKTDRESVIGGGGVFQSSFPARRAW